jgi:hypothetical protein
LATSVKLVPAKLTHIGPVATKMRAADQEECRAFGREPKDALRYSVRTSLEALTAIDGDGRPLAIMGVATAGLMSGKGVPWLLGTDEVFRHGRALLELGPRVIDAWLGVFDVLENEVSLENDRAIRLLRRWGAIVEGGPVVLRRGVQFVSFRFMRSS